MVDRPQLGGNRRQRLLVRRDLRVVLARVGALLGARGGGVVQKGAGVEMGRQLAGELVQAGGAASVGGALVFAQRVSFAVLGGSLWVRGVVVGLPRRVAEH